MLKLRRTWTFLAIAAVLSAGTSIGLADPAAAYSPGRAVAYRPTYVYTKDGYNWHCAFTHWRSDAKVVWHCNLREIYLTEAGWQNVLITSHSGSWTPGSSSYTTPTWLHKLTIGDGELCTEAYALSVDGSASQTTCAS